MASPAESTVDLARVLAPRRDALGAVLAALCVDAEAARVARACAGGARVAVVDDPAGGASVRVTPRDASCGELVAALREREPDAVWEALVARDLVPAGWATDEDRWFLSHEERMWCEACGGSGEGSNGWEPIACLACDGQGCDVRLTRRRRPATLAECVAFASDTRGVATAEALAREAVARFATWGTPRPRAVVWLTLPGPRFGVRYGAHEEIDGGTRLWPVLSAPYFRCVRARGDEFRADAPIPGVVDPAALAARGDAGAVRYTLIAAALYRSGAAVVPPTGPTPDPFAPLEDLLHTGYAFGYVTDAWMLLQAPPLAAPR